VRLIEFEIEVEFEIEMQFEIETPAGRPRRARFR